jgi:hypothetical protein
MIVPVVSTYGYCSPRRFSSVTVVSAHETCPDRCGEAVGEQAPSAHASAADGIAAEAVFIRDSSMVVSACHVRGHGA